MNTKLAISFERTGILNEMLAVIVASHNEGVNKVSIEELYGYLKCRRAEIAHSLKDMKIKFDKEENTLHILVDGENVAVSITENEYYTLEDTDGKALEEQIAGEDALLHIGEM